MVGLPIPASGSVLGVAVGVAEAVAVAVGLGEGEAVWAKISGTFCKTKISVNATKITNKILFRSERVILQR